MNYKEQYSKIDILLDRIKTKTYNFSETIQNPFFEDLFFVIKELEDIDNFLDDKYLIVKIRKEGTEMNTH